MSLSFNTMSLSFNTMSLSFNTISFRFGPFEPGENRERRHRGGRGGRGAEHAVPVVCFPSPLVVARRPALVEERHGRRESGWVALPPGLRRALIVPPLERVLQIRIVPEAGGATRMEFRSLRQTPIPPCRFRLVVDPLAQPLPAANEAFVRNVDHRAWLERDARGRHHERPPGPAEFFEHVDDLGDTRGGHLRKCLDRGRAARFAVICSLLAERLEYPAGDDAGGGGGEGMIRFISSVRPRLRPP